MTCLGSNQSTRHPSSTGTSSTGHGEFKSNPWVQSASFALHECPRSQVFFQCLPLPSTICQSHVSRVLFPKGSTKVEKKILLHKKSTGYHAGSSGFEWSSRSNLCFTSMARQSLDMERFGFSTCRNKLTKKSTTNPLAASPPFLGTNRLEICLFYETRRLVRSTVDVDRMT